MKRLAIIGSGDLGQLIAHHAASTSYKVVGFFDDFAGLGKEVKGYIVLGKIDQIDNKYSEDLFDELMIGIGYKHLQFRSDLFKKFQGKIPFANIIHNTVYVDRSVKLGEGIFILPGCVLDMNVVLSDNVLLNTGVKIAHDSKIGYNSFISPCVAIAGFVKVGQSCNIGINTTIIDNIKIGDFVQTGGGSIIIKSIDSPGLYVGNPSRKVR